MTATAICNKEKYKIISVLIHPRDESYLVQVTRAKGYFTFGQYVRFYSIPYGSPILDSFVKWSSKLASLSVEKIVRVQSAKSRS